MILSSWVFCPLELNCYMEQDHRPATLILQHLTAYPAFLALCALVTGIWVPRNIGSVEEPVLLWLPALGLGGVLFGLRRSGTVAMLVAIGVFFFLLGLFMASRDLPTGPQFNPPIDKRIVHATVVAKPSSGRDFRVLLLQSGTTFQDGLALPGRGRLVLMNCHEPLCSGDRIAFCSRVVRPINACNPGEFDWELYCRNQRIQWLAYVQGKDALIVLERGGRYTPSAVLYRVREALEGFLVSHFQLKSPEQALVTRRSVIGGIIKGIVIGDRGEMTTALNTCFVDTGLVHFLSAAGLHVSIVAFAAVVATVLLTRPAPSIYNWVPLKKLAAAVSVPAILFYCLLVGARPATVRATIMGLIVAVALITDRRWRSWNSLLITGLMILLVHPLSLFAADFQRSFAAVAGILVVIPVLGRTAQQGPQSGPKTDRVLTDRLGGVWTVLKRWLTGLLLTSGGASLGALPLLLWLSHSVPVYSVAANLVVYPLFMLALPLALVACFAGVCLPWLGSIIMWPAEVCIGIVVQLTIWIAHLPGSTLQIPHVSIFLMVPVTGICLSPVFILRRRTMTARGTVVTTYAALAAGMAAIWVGGQVCSWTERNLEVVFLNVGKADAAIVKFPSGHRMVVDAGARTDSFDAGSRFVVPALRWGAIKSLDWIMASHPDMDHVGGLLAVAKEMHVRAALWNPVELRPGSGLALALEAVASRGGQIVRADRNSPEMNVGKVKISFLNSPGPEHRTPTGLGSSNNTSVVAKLEFGDVSFLFTGDLERLAEQALLESGMPVKSTVLKVGHHGCKSSSSEAFIRAVAPKIALISCDANQWSKCPKPEVMRRLRESGARVFWTGRDGAVTMETDGKTVWVTTGRNPGAVETIPVSHTTSPGGRE